MPKSDESELSINDISSLPVQGPMTAQGARISQPSSEEQIQNTVNDRVFAILRGMKIDPAIFQSASHFPAIPTVSVAPLASIVPDLKQKHRNSKRATPDSLITDLKSLCL